MAANFIDRLLGRGDDDSTDPDGDPDMSEQEHVADTLDGPVDETRGPDVADLDARIDELETELSRNESSIRSIESNQDEIAEGIERIDDTVRQLLGVYDQLTASSNPFDDTSQTRGPHGTGAGRFGLIDVDASEPSDERDVEPAAGNRTAADDFDEADDEAVQPSVSFDDLLGEGDGSEGELADEADTADETDEMVESAEIETDEVERVADRATETSVPLAEDVSGDDASAGSSAPERADTRGASAPSPPGQLDSLPSGYAGDLLVMEWLAELVETAGSAGALKALAFYEEVGWISHEVRESLEVYLSGPAIDADVDPNCPVELTANDHVESYQYVLRLDAVDDIDVAFTRQA